jgi:hypothetical protein
VNTAWWLLRPTPPPASRRVAYTAPCPHGHQAQWVSDRVPAYGGCGDGVRVSCLCRCARCLLAVATVAAAPC